MVDAIFDTEFRKEFKRIKDKTLKSKIIKQIRKIKETPQAGKPMRHARKNTREVYVKPYRLSYIFENNTLIILALYHKDVQ